MAQPQPHLLTRGDVRRVKDCVDENVKLADCWKSDQVVIVACEPTGAHLSDTSLLVLDILSPAGNPVWGSKSSERHPTRQFCKKSIRMLEKRKDHRWLQPRPWYGVYDCREEFQLYRYEAMGKAREIFSELCLGASESPDWEGIQEELRRYTDENVEVRNRRYDRKPWPVTGLFGMPNMALLEVLGPAAESHRRNKTEKRDAAMKRIMRRMAVGDIPVGDRGRT